MNEMKNGLWNLFLVWDPNENNDNPILYKWFSAHLIVITDGKGLSTSNSFIIDFISKWKRNENILYNTTTLYRTRTQLTRILYISLKIRLNLWFKFRSIFTNFWDHFFQCNNHYRNGK